MRAAVYRGLKAEVTLEVYTGYRAFSLGLLLDILKDSKRARGVKLCFTSYKTATLKHLMKLQHEHHNKA